MSSLDPRLNPGAPWNITVIPGPLFDMLVKLPLIASDALVALLLYRLVRNQTGNEKLANLVPLIWFLNPLTIWISSGWGTFDTLPALFTVLALYLVFDGRFALSGISLAVAIGLKYYPVVLTLPLFILALDRGGRRGLAESLGSTGLTSLLFFVPSLSDVTSGFTFLAGGQVPSGLHYSGLSFWTGITLFFPASPQTIVSAAITIMLLGVSYLWMWRRKVNVDQESGAIYFGLPILVLLLAFRFVGENYFVWLLPFGSILATTRTRISLLLILSLLALASALTGSFLPYYLLPVASWNGGLLVSIIEAAAPYMVAPGGTVTAAASLGKVLLSVLGSATAILTLTGYEWVGGSSTRPRRLALEDNGAVAESGGKRKITE
jgi:hypothetical protein